MGHDTHAQGAVVSANAQIAVAAFCLAIGIAGPPLEPLRILGAVVLCGAVSLGGRFVAAAALLAVIAAGWLQHNQFRIALLAAAAILGIVVRFWGSSPRAAAAIMGLAAVAGTAWLFLG
jgi:hypothetical protein